MKGAAQEDSTFQPSAFERLLEARPLKRWMGWRVRLLVLAALIGCVALFSVLRALSVSPHVDALWTSDDAGRLVLQASLDPSLQPQVGATLLGVSSGGGASMAIDEALLTHSPRWLVRDRARAEHVVRRIELQRIFQTDRITLFFSDGTSATVAPRPRGFAGLPALIWLLGALALVVYMVGIVVFMARPQASNAMYALMATAQAIALGWLGVDAVDGLGANWLGAIDSLPWRIGLDLVTAAGSVHVFTLYPTRLTAFRWLGPAAWTLAATITVLAFLGQLPYLWWWGQGIAMALGATAIVVLWISFRTESNPFATVLKRLGYAALGTMAMVSATVGAAWWQSAVPYEVAIAAAVVWYVFLASLLLLVPFLSRARLVIREFAMLAGLSTVAVSLDLLFISVFSLGQFTSLTLAVFIALAAYAAARQWVLNQMLGSSLITTERTFEQLYRVAREVQQHPERHAVLLTQLLQDLFDPMETFKVARAAPQARVVADGAALVVPLLSQGDAASSPVQSLVLRYAYRGKRIFTREDARLTDRVVDQLRRAVAYDAAVERGRAEERLRIAQDLHDDIGARLLTLMYKAQTQEIEEYVRHTLQDLKTLTRGLAASEHRLSHAAAEWKADLQQRLSAAQIELSWQTEFERDIVLTVVQWSGLTRILRELISNAIAHANARRVAVFIKTSGPGLQLRLQDDGEGRSPERWAHGLGLGGIRKRVKLLGGRVQWREQPERGIVCEVDLPDLGRRA